MKKSIEITDYRLYKWIVPMFGNKHYKAYGSIMVEGKVNGEKVSQLCKTKGDMTFDTTPFQYIIFQGQRYIFRNLGTLHSPIPNLVEWKKETINGHKCYTENYK